jgi:RimJ/RimL family protein N-acetyltransferase
MIFYPRAVSDIELTALTMADAAAHLSGEDGELVRWLSGGRSTPATVEAYLRGCVQQWDDGGAVLAFGIRVGDPPQLAGTIEIQTGQPYLQLGQVNLAYGLYPVWRGRGIAGRAVDLACRIAKARGAWQAIIRVDPANASSVAVASRCGFTCQGIRCDEPTSLQWWTRDLSQLV